MAMVNRYRFACRAVLLIPFILGLWGCESEPVTPVQDVKIEMTGNDFKWKSRYAGKDGEFNTEGKVHGLDGGDQSAVDWKRLRAAPDGN